MLIQKFSAMTIVLPLHVDVTDEHTDHIVEEKDHDARDWLAFVFTKLDKPDVKATDAEWVSSALFVIESVTVFSSYVGQWLWHVSPRALFWHSGI